MRLAGVTSTNLNFLPGARALLAGLAQHHPEVDRYCLACPEEVSAIAAELGDLARVLPIPRPILQAPLTSAKMALVGRYFVSTVPADVVAYFDCDMVLCGPVGRAWGVAPGRVRAVADYAACVTDMLDLRHRDAFRKAYPEVAASPGVNSGFFSLRPADWPDLAGRFEQSVRGAGIATLPDCDQPFANQIFLPHLDPLPLQYNAHCVTDYAIPAGVRVLHFTGSLKPWMPTYPRHEPAYYYWLRHGVGERSRWRLALALLRIGVRTPRRLLSRLYKNRPRRSVTVPEGTA